GYSRPSNHPSPLDTELKAADAKAMEDATTIAENENIYSATVYFAVYRNQGDKAKKGDTFGTGIDNFDDRLFRRGHCEDGQVAPALDKEARYLYLYQAVNDRGT